MALPPAFLDELRARTPLAPLIARKARLVRNGRQWKGCCPFHAEKSPSFHVYDDHFHCFGCGAHGDAITFVMRADGASFPEAVERLAAEAGIEVPRPTPQAAAREARARDLHGVLEAAAAAFARRLRAPEGAAGLAYLRRRGLTDETIARFGLGWSGAGRGALAAELRDQGVEPAQLVEAGLAREGGGEFFFDRVVFPIRDRRGRAVSFGGRILGDGQPKYLNGPETALFAKRRTLYGLDLAREAAFRGAAVVAVEGYMDVIALHQAGFAGAVAPLGTALTEDQLGELWRLSPEPVLCFDGDAAGARAAARTVELALPLLAPERTLRVLTLGDAKDPDELVSRGGAAAFHAALEGALPLSEALFGLLAPAGPAATPEARAAFRHRLEAAARAIPDRALAGEYRSSLLERFFAVTRRPRAGERPGTIPRRPPPPRPALVAGGARERQARALLAILLRHPALLPEVEEALGALDLPEGPATALRGALLDWLAGAGALDSGPLGDHLHASGLERALAWAAGGDDLAVRTLDGAAPEEALGWWWHFRDLLRGSEQLAEDHAAAQRHWIETNDPASALRMTRLAQALQAARRGGAADGPGGGPGDGAADDA